MKILVGYDGSSASRQALNLGIKRAKTLHAEIQVVTSLTGGKETTADEIKDATRELESAKQVFEEAGITGDIHLLVKGHFPGEDIVQFAEENMVDEIIIGIKKRSKTAKLLFGSNAQSIILKAPCPVITVK